MRFRKGVQRLSALFISISLAFAAACGSAVSPSNTGGPGKQEPQQTETSGKEESKKTETSGQEAQKTETSEQDEPAEKEAQQTTGVTAKPGTLGTEGVGRRDGSRYISLHRTFTAAGREYELILTGLTEENAAGVLEALQALDPDAGDPLRLEDPGFVDAEKWDTYSEIYDESRDSNQCWAAAVSNMLMISGWTGGHNDQRTGSPFDSEDEIFTFFNDRITNRGCDSIPALGWFFMGEFAPDWESSHPAMLTGEEDPSDGIIKNFVVTVAAHEYDLIADTSGISELERLDMASSDPAVFECSTGSLLDGCLLKSMHAMTAVGIITDPEAKSIGDRYKAIILADSDNDGFPDESVTDPDSVPADRQDADKKACPNTYTVYRLDLNRDAEGTEFWEVVGYGDEDTTALYSIVSLPMASEDILSAFRETEGSCDVISDPDLVPGLLFTTSDEESVQDPFYFDREESVKTVFEAGEAINLNFFISNRGYRTFDDEYRGTSDLTANWKVTDGTGFTVAEGSVICNEELYNSYDTGYLVGLNNADGVVADWPAGRYTVFLSVNEDHAIKEAYYLNNTPAEFTFEIR